MPRVEILKNRRVFRPGVLIGVPTTGIIRYEWHAAQMSVIIPTNWQAGYVAQTISSPLGFSVAEGRNLIVHTFLQRDFEWLFFLDHDVLCPPNTFIWLDEHLRKRKSPIVSGLYCTKSYPSEPLIYRGRGNGAFRKFKLGDTIEADGMGMGFTLIHRELIECLAAKAPKIRALGQQIAQVFVTPRETYVDPETQQWVRQLGTEDLHFCSRAKQILKETSWKKLAKKSYPFLVDTRMFCWHIDMSGQRYPIDIDLPPGYAAWDRTQKRRKWASRG